MSKAKQEKPQIKLDPRNYRVHTEENKTLLAQSLKELGAGRSILASADGTCLAGNGILEQALKQKIPLKVVKTVGDELVVVQRMDIKDGTQEAKEMALADNAISDTSANSWNQEFVEQDFKDETRQKWHLEFTDKTFLDELEAGHLQNAINSNSDIFSITFNFPKEYEEQVKRALKVTGRDILAKRILDLILAEEPNA
ncbi:MAG: hypothetical protein J6Y25_04615 [Elusimicrobiaceae bacterium]|nr:hypothetical protein [Elusimicrobiaceae bacterium]